MFKSRRFIYIFFAIIALYTLLIQQFLEREGKYLFETPVITQEFNYDYTSSFQELNLRINQELSLHGVWFKQDSSIALVLLFPTSQITFNQIEIAKSAYFAAGFDVLIPAYRGTAKSSGELKTEDDLYADAQHWYNFAISQFTAKDVIIAGQGFGGTIAAHLAKNNSAKALILEAPYYSYGEYQSKKRWWMPHAFLTSYSLDTWKSMDKIDCPIILIQNESNKSTEKDLAELLKPKDKFYWLKNSKEIPFSFQKENNVFFKHHLELLDSQTKSD